MVALVVNTASLIAVIGVVCGQFMNTDDCTCPDDVVTFNCNVTGGGFTIWRGSAFDCPRVGSIVLLRHSLFASGVMKQCNDGGIIGQSLGISTNSLGNIYMSQLMINLTASSSAIGQTIECIHRNPSGEDTVIGSTTLEITDPPPPPSNIQLVDVSPKQLVFSWTKVDSNCSTFKYKVLSNCGTCLDDNTIVENTANSVACSIDLSAVTNNMTMCSFRLVNMICSDKYGTESTPLNVTLKVPQPPEITSTIPHYNKTDNKLIGIDIKFNEGESYMISSRIDGSALNYTISYTDSETGDVCYSLTISASSCVQGICTVPSISPLSQVYSEIAGGGNIDVSISATNRLGTGPSSFTTIGQTNIYFNVSFETINKIMCTQWHLSQQKSRSTVICNAVYWPCQQPMDMITHGTYTSSSNTVNIDLLERGYYCYAINASNGTFTILIEGAIKSSDQYTTSNSESCRDTVAVFLVLYSVSLAIIIIILSLLYMLNYRRNKDSKKAMKHTGINKPTVTVLERDGDHTILITLQDKPWQLMQALEVFQESEIDIVDVKIIEHKYGYGKIWIQCKESPSDDKVKRIERHIEFITRKDVPALQKFNTGQQMTYSQSFPPIGKYGSLYTFIKQVRYIGMINITDINIRPTSANSTYRDVTLKFYCEPGYPKNWKEEFDQVFAQQIKVCGSDL